MLIIKQEIDDSAKRFIINQYFLMKMDKAFFMDKAHQTFVETLARARVHASIEEFGFSVMCALTLKKKFNRAEEDIVNFVKENKEMEVLFDILKEEKFVDEMMSTAEVIHVEIDPNTGAVKTPTMH